MPGFTEISPATLMRLVGTPDAPTILDVCLDDDFALDARVIPTARRVHHLNALTEIDNPDQAVVVVCQKGLKLSHGAAAILRSHGINAQVLEGGMFGWRDAGMPMVPYSQIPQPSLWVTRHRPKIDRIACPWLIRRFIDPGAQFMFVPPAHVDDIATRFNATPFDVANATWQDAAGKCTFDAMVDAFHLHTDALSVLAQVVRAADTGRLSDAPQAAGLLAMSVGLSRQFKDDVAQMEAGFAIYDALYRWARDGQSETHGTGAHHD